MRDLILQGENCKNTTHLRKKGYWKIKFVYCFKVVRLLCTASTSMAMNQASK